MSLIDEKNILKSKSFWGIIGPFLLQSDWIALVEKVAPFLPPEYIPIVKAGTSFAATLLAYFGVKGVAKREKKIKKLPGILGKIV